MFQPSPRPEPLQEPLSKLTLIFVASFPGSSCGDAFSCWEERDGEGDQRGKRNCQLGWEEAGAHQTLAHPQDGCPERGGRGGRRGLLSPSKPGNPGQMGTTGAAGKGTAAPEHHGSRGGGTGCSPVCPRCSSAPSAGAPRDPGLGTEPHSLRHHRCGSDPWPWQPRPLHNQHCPDYHKYSRSSRQAGQQPESPSAASGSAGDQASGLPAAPRSPLPTPGVPSTPRPATPHPRSPLSPPAVLLSGSTSPMLLSIYGNTSSRSAKDTIIKAH